MCVVMLPHLRKQGKYDTSMYKPLWHHAGTRQKEDINTPVKAWHKSEVQGILSLLT